MGEVEHFWEDQDGMMWLAAAGRLWNMSGNSLDFAESPYYLGHSIRSIQRGSQNELWLGDETGGLWVLAGRNLRSYQSESWAISSPISGVVRDRLGRLWIATYGQGVWQMDSDGNLLPEPLLPDQEIYALEMDLQGNIWAGSDQGLYVWIGNEKKVDIQHIGPQQGLPDPLVTHLIAAPDSGVWVAMYDGGVCHLNHPKAPVWRLPGSEGLPEIVQLIHQGTQLWVGTRKLGIICWELNGRAGTFISKKTELPSDLRTFFIDEEDNLWAATNQGIHLRPIHFQQLFSRIGKVRCLESGQDGMWLGSERGLWFAPERQDSLRRIPTPASLAIVSLFEDEAQRLWIGTMSNGLWILESPTGEIRPVETNAQFPGSPPILSISGTKNQLWFATFGGLYRGTETTTMEVQLVEELRQASVAYVYHTLTDRQERLWVATDGHGVWMKDQGLLAPLKGMDIGSIVCMAEGQSGTIWLGGEQGQIWSYNQGNIDWYEPAHYMTGIRINAIFPLSDTLLLLVHEHGLGLFFPRHHDYLEIGQPWRMPLAGEGLNAIEQDRQGNLWIGSEAGVIHLNKALLQARLRPEVFISSVWANFQPIAVADSCLLNHDQNHLVIRYQSRWNQAPEQFRFEHRLIGWDSIWESSRNSQAIYSQLPPGTYRFELRGQSIHGNLVTDTCYVEFQINQPLWQRSWFLFLLVTGLIGLLYGWIKWRERSLKKKEELRRQAISFHLQTLRSQINPHFLFNSFNTLIGLIEETPATAVTFVEKMADFFRSILEFRQEETISLAEEKKFLDNYLDLLSERFEGGFTYTWQVPDELVWHRIPPLTLQVLVENAFKHNIASHRNPLNIKISSLPTGYLVVQNNLQKRKKPKPSTNMGLKNLIDRYDLLDNRKVRIEITAHDFLIFLPLLPPPTPHSSASSPTDPKHSVSYVPSQPKHPHH